VADRSEAVKLRVVPQEAVWRPGLKMWRGFMVGLRLFGMVGAVWGRLAALSF
jgi:hypothetical protein